MSAEEDVQTPAAGVELDCSRLFGHWLATESASLSLACSGKRGLALIGRNDQAKPALGIFDYPAMHAVAAANDGTLWVAEKNWLWKLENGMRTAGFSADKRDIFLPRLRMFTGDLGITDLAVDGNNALLMTSSKFCLLGKATTEAGIEPIWRPAFLAGHSDAFGRCRLSGVALYDAPRHCVTLWSGSAKADEGKETCIDSGVVMAIENGGIFCEGLCLPCTPRWHQNQLYLVNAGTAEFGKVDLEKKSFVPLCQCPSYPTGVAFHGQWAAISVSCEPPAGMESIPASETFASRGIQPFAGLLLVDLRSGDIAHNARFDQTIKRVDSVAVLPGVTNAFVLGPNDEKLDSLVTIRRQTARNASAE